MAERHIGAVLIGEGNRLQGIFTERDLLIRVIARGLDPDATQLKEVMTPDPDTVGPNDWASLALERMRSSGYRHVPVVDDGIVVGIVSLRDLYAAARSEGRSVGKEGVRTCRSRWSPSSVQTTFNIKYQSLIKR